jgi:hypothetical protein
MLAILSVFVVAVLVAQQEQVAASVALLVGGLLTTLGSLCSFACKRRSWRRQRAAAAMRLRDESGAVADSLLTAKAAPSGGLASHGVPSGTRGWLARGRGVCQAAWHRAVTLPAGPRSTLLAGAMWAAGTVLAFPVQTAVLHAYGLAAGSAAATDDVWGTAPPLGLVRLAAVLLSMGGAVVIVAAFSAAVGRRLHSDVLGYVSTPGVGALKTAMNAIALVATLLALASMLPLPAVFFDPLPTGSRVAPRPHSDGLPICAQVGLSPAAGWLRAVPAPRCCVGSRTPTLRIRLLSLTCNPSPRLRPPHPCSGGTGWTRAT